MYPAISYRADPAAPGLYNGLFALASDTGWRVAKDAFGEPARFATPAEAEARAGHGLVAALRSMPDPAPFPCPPTTTEPTEHTRQSAGPKGSKTELTDAQLAYKLVMDHRTVMGLATVYLARDRMLALSAALWDATHPPAAAAPEGETIILADLDAWATFAVANREALVETYGSVDAALKHACDGGLTLGGGAAPLFHVTFAL